MTMRICMAFADIHPQAPVHVLVIPKEHLQSTAHAEASHGPLLGKLMAAAAVVAKGARAERRLSAGSEYRR